MSYRAAVVVATAQAVRNAAPLCRDSLKAPENHRFLHARPKKGRKVCTFSVLLHLLGVVAPGVGTWDHTLVQGKDAVLKEEHNGTRLETVALVVPTLQIFFTERSNRRLFFFSSSQDGPTDSLIDKLTDMI